MGSTLLFTEGEVVTYRREGWLLVEDMLSSGDLSELDGAIQTVADAALVDNNEAAYVEFEQEDTSSRPALRRVLDPYARHEAFRAIAHDARIVDRVESLLGSDLDLHHSKLNFKPARVGSPVEWHQDLGYYPHTNDGVLAVLIYLDEATENNGCLQVMQRQHNSYLDHAAPGATFVGRIMDESLGEMEPLPLPARAGSAIFLHGLTPHASLPNESSSDRRTLIFAYRAGDAYPLYYGAVTVEDETVLRPVRGRRAQHARFGGPSPIVPRIDTTSSLYEIQAADRVRRDHTWDPSD
jgi:ectoine hydroxylase-related dioxygenase (phytanoyl-CoA dioxygenase family)